MDISQNFDKNLKKSVKKNSHSLPSGSKFILQQLLKNSEQIEENLSNEPMVEINVGSLKKVIKNILSEGKKCTLSSECPDGNNWVGICTSGRCKKCKNSDYPGCLGGGMTNPGSEDEIVSIDKIANSDLGSLEKEIESEMGEATSSASAGAYVTPRFWAKNKKNRRFAKKRLMPGAKYVRVKNKCKKFPYCNQGDLSALEIWEKEIMRESAKNVAKKTGKSESEVREMIEKEISEIIRRGFYKSPVTDLVGGGKMNTPIGKIFNLNSPNVGPKYES
jgi:hypothetical protein|tara:strand:- start:889 stop:1716 length:828 start_codon:yes stop_codon:yes gene_type:complete